ncbi:amylo-alpha-1,6-glucosidase [Vacuolonema iberomarrocanum]|uniref:amylo-alpha-1,6-glucosidase n=1 Tax=Vacuolonema iberomarrocanum TaxID=3454632 RepID=UPI001A06A9F7|nr:glycogen debranching enzyme family protein [filamentous cyanobacterium LEGE 07170]
MDELDTREWLLTNGLGGFASGTVSDARTRTYHGLLVAAIAPPGERTLLLAQVDAVLMVGGHSYELSTNYWRNGDVSPRGDRWLQSFSIDPLPTWVWGGKDWQLTRQILMPHADAVGEDAGNFAIEQRNRVLIHYHLEGENPARLTLLPLIGDRNFHHQQRYDRERHFSQVVEPRRVIFQSHYRQLSGISWQLSWSQGNYQPDSHWYWGYLYPEETKRGLSDREDLYNPGKLIVLLETNDTVTLEASVRGADGNAPPPPTRDIFTELHRRNKTRLATTFDKVTRPQTDPSSVYSRLLQAGDQFIAYRASIQGSTIIAGYPWFGDWGRDALIALPGLALTTQRHELARSLLHTFGQYCNQGLIPNTFPDEDAIPLYNSLDATLWWIETLGLYLDATQDWDFLVQQYPIVQQIYKAFTMGTIFDIRVDALDGLLSWESPGHALTWMDAVVSQTPITPRQGKAVEINALWYSALCWAEKWARYLHTHGLATEAMGNIENHARRYAQQAGKVKAGLQSFWNPETGYFHDVIKPDDQRSPEIRPNGVIALSLAHCGFELEQGQQVLEVACERLLTPYGLRSLAPESRFYIGQYVGSVWQRDRAYHQGTVWSWLIGPFIRAWKRYYPDEPIPWMADALLEHLEHEACLGSISEIFDGNTPYPPRGAIAQAWSVAELLRHWDDLYPPSGNKPELMQNLRNPDETH